MATIQETLFGLNGARLYQLTNANGLTITLTNYGARIVDILVPVTGEEPRNISLATKSAEEYFSKDAYVGATIVPVAGRISNAKATIKGQVYAFTENEPNRTLHGGIDTANEHIWQTEVDEADNVVRFNYQLVDGKNGFPGNVTITATFQLTEENALRICYQAVSDKDTLFNPTNHVYFNLTGNVDEPVNQHWVRISAQKFAALNNHHMPSGELLAVSETPFDFRYGALFNQGFSSLHSQIALVNGYDHPWILDQVETAVEVVSPDEKVRLSLSTNQPAVVVYTYNHGPTSFAPEHGVFSLECQALPDACNIEGFGSILLEANQEFISETNYSIEWK